MKKKLKIWKNVQKYLEHLLNLVEGPVSLGRIAWRLAAWTRKPKVPGSNPVVSYVQR